MACNCSTKEEIDRLYKMYAVQKNVKPEKGSHIELVMFYIKNILLLVMTIIAFPFLVIYILCLLFWRNNNRLKINDFDFLRVLKHNGRN